jgi:DNA replication protein DnaC
MEPLGEALGRVRAKLPQTPTDAAPETEVDPACPICKDYGFVRRDVPLGDVDFGRAIPCTCRQGELRERLRRRSNLGSLGSRTFETFLPEGRESLSDVARERLRDAYDVCRAYAEMPRGWLVLGGPSGCGKTHLAAAIANRQIELGAEVFFAVVPDLLDHLRATFGPGTDVTYDELFESVRGSVLLVLDDLGTQTSSAWAQEKLFQLLNSRFNTELPTVITTNHRLAELDERLRSRLEDRRLSRVLRVPEPENPHVEALLSAWPRGLRHQTFESFKDEQADGFTRDEAVSLRSAHNAALEFANAPEGWLVLVGGFRCGKTHLAAAIKNERDKFSQPTVFMTVPDLLDYLRATYAPNSEVTYDRGFELIRDAPVLILDDYGAQRSTPWAEEKLFQLLNYRFNARLPTVITSNLPLHEPASLAAGQVQELRIVSRLIDPGLSKVVRIDAPPYRNPELRVVGDRRGRGGRAKD